MEKNNSIMKSLLTLSIFLIFACYSPSEVHNIKESKNADKVFTFKFLDSLLKEPKKCLDKYETLISYLDTINYGGKVIDIMFGHDTLAYVQNNGPGVDLLYYKSLPLEKINLSESLFNVDSMYMAIDFQYLEICHLKKDDNYLIIKTVPYNWVGRMLKYNLYQIINKKEKYVIYFIQEG